MACAVAWDMSVAMQCSLTLLLVQWPLHGPLCCDGAHFTRSQRISLPVQIPYQDAISFHERIDKSDLVLVDGADHNFQKSAHADFLIKHVVHFLLNSTVMEDAKA